MYVNRSNRNTITGDHGSGLIRKGAACRDRVKDNHGRDIRELGHIHCGADGVEIEGRGTTRDQN
jgi:hypothetical protein